MSDQLVIRTMKDDIAEMNSLPPEAPAVPVKIKRKDAQAPVFSLPSKPTPLHSSAEPTSSKKRNNILIGIGYILLFFVLVGGGVYGYMQWSGMEATQDIPGEELSLFQVIPKEALAVVEYNVSTQENKDAILKMWTESTGENASSASEGNPTTILSLLGMNQLAYVLLPDDPKPFLLIRKDEGSKEYVAQQSGVQSLEIGGWYIIHTANIDQYSLKLAEGAISEGTPLVGTMDTPNYLIRYGMSPAFVSQQFNTLASSTIGLSRLDGLVFYVLAPENDGTVRASAHVAGNPSGDGVSILTDDLVSLVPSDITFAYVGLNLFDELNVFQANSSLLDGSILAQPAIRQFLALLNTPYTIFERKGSDGIRDIGLVVKLPDSLRQKIKVGEPIVEQALPALIPLIVGKVLGIQLAFNDGLYNAVPVRYVNVSGQTQALDYSIGDNFLLISSSREGISSLIDTSLAGKQGISLEEPWKSLGEKAGQIIKNKAFVAGTLKDPALRSVLPVSSSIQQVPVMISWEKTSTGVDIQALLSVR